MPPTPSACSPHITSATALPKQCSFLKAPGSLSLQHWHFFLECASLPHRLSQLSAFKVKFEHHSLRKAFRDPPLLILSTLGRPTSRL